MDHSKAYRSNGRWTGDRPNSPGIARVPWGSRWEMNTETKDLHREKRQLAVGSRQWAVGNAPASPPAQGKWSRRDSFGADGRRKKTERQEQWSTETGVRAKGVPFGGDGRLKKGRRRFIASAVSSICVNQCNLCHPRAHLKHLTYFMDESTLKSTWKKFYSPIGSGSSTCNGSPAHEEGPHARKVSRSASLPLMFLNRLNSHINFLLFSSHS